jgi:hypothetical protein
MTWPQRTVRTNRGVCPGLSLGMATVNAERVDADLMARVGA